MMSLFITTTTMIIGRLRSLIRVLNNPDYTKYFAPPIWILDFILSYLIIVKVPYTEIDWQAYIDQINMVLGGERDYRHIKGSTGPLVYPGGHVQVYTALYQLTNEGTNVRLAQYMFMAIYLITLALVMLSYIRAQAPPYTLFPLILSKRLHSIYLLRLFNDCFNVLAMWIAIFCLENRLWTMTMVWFGLSIGIKMNSLLYLPAIGIILIQAVGARRSMRLIPVVLQIQVLIALPFISSLDTAISYLSRAFDFSRQFMFKWTVNWKFVPEPIFQSPTFALCLLLLHTLLLLVFAGTRWNSPSGGKSILGIMGLVFKKPNQITQAIYLVKATADYILTTMLTSNLIGMLCARSLHYQFFSWMSWGTPYLLYKTRWPLLVQAVIWIIQEASWNVYPSNSLSSLLVVGTMALTLIGVWIGSGKDAKLTVDDKIIEAKLRQVREEQLQKQREKDGEETQTEPNISTSAASSTTKPVDSQNLQSKRRTAGKKSGKSKR